jgi:hypothetical protein
MPTTGIRRGKHFLQFYCLHYGPIRATHFTWPVLEWDLSIHAFSYRYDKVPKALVILASMIFRIFVCETLLKFLQKPQRITLHRRYVR